MDVRQERRQLAKQLRREGRTWVAIGKALQERWPELTPRAALRVARGWTQEKAAEEWTKKWPKSPRARKDISLWETWPHGGRRPSLDVLDKMAELYKCSLADLVADISDYRDQDVVNPPRIPVDMHVVEEDDVERREFLAGAITSTVMPNLDSRPRVGMTDVRALEADLQGLFALDDHSGGGAVQRKAVEHLATIQAVLDGAGYSETTGRKLRTLAGQTAEMAGWAAYDAGQPATARNLYQDALYIADLAENERLRTLVFTSMSLNTLAAGNAREALELSHAAQRTARPFATSKLVSLLASREAVAWSHLGEGHRCHGALRHSEQALDESNEELDPEDEWLAFWGPAQLMGTVAHAHARLGDYKQAEAAARAALDLAPRSYRRNEALYRVRLAETLVMRGQLDEGASVALTLQQMGDVTSSRVLDRLHSMKRALAPHDAIPEVQELLGR